MPGCLKSVILDRPKYSLQKDISIIVLLQSYLNLVLAEKIWSFKQAFPENVGEKFTNKNYES